MKNRLISTIATVGLLLTSCSLDMQYLNGPAAGTFPANEAEAMSGLLGAYKNLTDMDASSTPFPAIQDNATDIGASRINTSNYTDQIRSQISTQNGMVEKLYDKIYRGDRKSVV